MSLLHQPRDATARDHLHVSEREDYLLARLPSSLWLHLVEPGDETWVAAQQVLMLYVRGGKDGSANRWAQAAKLLHLKRPGFFPVTDSRFWETYAGPLASVPKSQPKPHDWIVVRDELLANGASTGPDDRDHAKAFGQLRAAIESYRGKDPDQKVPDLLAATDLRLLDIAAWSAPQSRRSDPHTS